MYHKSTLGIVSLGTNFFIGCIGLAISSAGRVPLWVIDNTFNLDCARLQ